MIAILILGITLGAILFALTTSAVTADALRDNTIAAGLAQEGIEVVRNIRDNEWLSGSGPYGSAFPAGQYELQWNDPALTLASSLRFLKKDPATGLFSYDAGTATIFKRRIVVETVSDAESRITVYIEWSNRGADKVLEAEEHLFNWY